MMSESVGVLEGNERMNVLKVPVEEGIITIVPINVFYYILLKTCVYVY